jgi:hypothetical protein
VPRKRQRDAAGRPKGLRLSKESKKIGDRGEFVVYEYERAKVRRLGFDPDLVKWLAREGETPGWDITSVDAGGPIYIEGRQASALRSRACLLRLRSGLRRGNTAHFTMSILSQR